VPTFADRGCRVVGATDPPAVNSVFLTEKAQLTVRKYSQVARLNSADISSDEELSLEFKLYLRGFQV
jgi:hypothetical protein